MVDDADLELEPEVDLDLQPTEEQQEERPKQPEIDYRPLLNPLQDHMAAPSKYQRLETKREQWVTRTVQNVFGSKRVTSLEQVPAHARYDWRLDWLADQWSLDYWLHGSYTKDLGGEDRIWAPDYPMLVELTVPLLVAIKQGPTIIAQLKVSPVLTQSQEIMLRRAEVKDYKVDERDDPAMPLTHDGTDERFIEYDDRGEFAEMGLNPPRKARLARAIFDQPAEEDTHIVAVAEVGEYLVIRALTSHGKVVSVEGDEKPKLARPKLHDGMRKATKAKKAKEAKQFVGYTLTLHQLGAQLAGEADGRVADDQWKAAFKKQEPDLNNRRLKYQRGVAALLRSGVWVKEEKDGVISYRLVGDVTPQRTYL